MSEWLSGWMLSLQGQPHWLGLAIFLAALTECLAIAGLLVPGTVLLFALAVLAGSGVLELWQTLLLAWLGGLCGDLLSYLLGRRQHQQIRNLPYLREHPQWLRAAEQYFQRYGVLSLLIGRFIGPLRPLLPMVAGMFDMPFLRFLLVSLLAAAGWSVAYLLPGWATGAALRLPLPEGFWPQLAGVAAGLGLLIALAVHGSLREQRQVTRLAAGLSLLLVLGLLLGWRQLGALDQGLFDLLQTARSARLDQWMVLLTAIGDRQVQTLAGLLLVLLLLLGRQRRAALFAATSLLSSALAVSLLKRLLERPRPAVLLESLGSFSLPSGHSAAAFALFLVLGVLAGRGQPGRWRVTWLLLAGMPALLVALSRVYLGVHWPTDILAGALLAGGLCAGSLWLVQRHSPLPALPARVWYGLLPVALLLAVYSLWGLPAALALYRY
ncbi:bifunctional DedA family/phosphatase PAP2 family protein [Pseudomonas sp. N040]|uniref:bifunctional DedA family/phosphatase PAP2 family protein n=1 Tax=Pseudomonas sp. N040 TaxID=2785325 RepID=UPI0018A2A42A|nr:bifunctional DedA family/phosphatase PAP2 family protein [Pseudomonas sp. N040]MBF7730186.1 bifunctional DedA family/phosphatase PAP2 family protein [Pseudomonas sp. N040]MBW7013828.1 bifunctional DedA family/phosphatase PAP2 family protein [Pseudomonas sp. N040]